MLQIKNFRNPQDVNEFLKTIDEGDFISCQHQICISDRASTIQFSYVVIFRSH